MASKYNANGVRHDVVAAEKTKFATVKRELSAMGFAIEKRMEFGAPVDESETVWMARGKVRVVVTLEEGIEIFAFDNPNFKRAMLDWSMKLSGNVPMPIVISTIKASVAS